LSLEQYQNELSQAGHKFRPKRCPNCQRSALRAHGHYNRKADRSRNANLNPIQILRFYCPKCRRTCSVLPECIPQKRWYLWQDQEQCLLACFNGCSMAAIARDLLPSRQTITRWLHWVTDRFKEFRPDLSSRFPVLGYESEVLDWWKRLLGKIRLSKAMVILHGIGVNIP